MEINIEIKKVLYRDDSSSTVKACILCDTFPKRYYRLIGTINIEKHNLVETELLMCSECFNEHKELSDYNVEQDFSSE